jgi:PhnB protein
MMASRLNPYISFQGQAREALEFYGDVFGGTPAISTYAEFGQSGPDAGLVMHGTLETDRGFALMASDTPSSMREGSEPATRGPISISLSGDDGEALRSYWEKLSDGGTVTTALAKQVWGDEYGDCVDRFGVRWLVDIMTPAE